MLQSKSIYPPLQPFYRPGRFIFKNLPLSALQGGVRLICSSCDAFGRDTARESAVLPLVKGAGGILGHCSPSATLTSLENESSRFFYVTSTVLEASLLAEPTCRERIRRRNPSIRSTADVYISGQGCFWNSDNLFHIISHFQEQLAHILAGYYSGFRREIS